MLASRWKNIVQAARYQLYIARQNNPFLNLSIEHYLLQKTPPDSRILFLYINRPCVVIGRNQNPWLETNLSSRKRGKNSTLTSTGASAQNETLLVRRRSGGGAVFHDEGNINYSVISPSSAFTRDRHAEMVTRAIRKFNDRARVNERHDIVLDQGKPKSSEILAHLDLDDMHVSRYNNDEPEHPSLKVSGSAYKLTRQRSLHHGTCLLHSDRIALISQYLRSPTRPYLKARGVESVRSPVGNIFSLSDPINRSRRQHELELGILQAFVEMYNVSHKSLEAFQHGGLSWDPAHSDFHSDELWAAGYLGEDLKDIPEISDGVAELKVCSTLKGSRARYLLTGQVY